MKFFPILSAVILNTALYATPLRAEDPTTVKLTPEVQALLNDLLKTANEGPKQEPAPANPPAAATAPAAPATPTAPAAAPKTASPLTPTSLKTSTLQTSSLTPSAPLGGRGLTGGTPRLNDADWRQLFPVKEQK